MGVVCTYKGMQLHWYSKKFTKKMSHNPLAYNNGYPNVTY